MNNNGLVTQLRKAFQLIAKGLIKKQDALEANPKQYPYVPCLNHGINMFLALTYDVGQAGAEIFQAADEHAFFERYLCRPVEEWFDGWNPEVLTKLSIREQEFYSRDAFAFLRDDNYYCPSDACCEFLYAQEPNVIEGTDENTLYENLKQLSPEDYCSLRQYIINNPVITITERGRLLSRYSDNSVAKNAIFHVYERFEERAYRCPDCGWTMKKIGDRLICHSQHCKTSKKPLEACEIWDGENEELYRLKKGIMRYIVAPGQPELEVARFCQKRKLDFSLWPEKDKYDVEIRFPDGTVWEIDAKTYRNPWFLKRHFESRGGFPTGTYQQGFVVIPDKLKRKESKYTQIVNKALKTPEDNVRCVTMRTLKIEINRKAASDEEEE